jgi:hypothetical protein
MPNETLTIAAEGKKPGDGDGGEKTNNEPKYCHAAPSFMLWLAAARCGREQRA